MTKSQTFDGYPKLAAFMADNPRVAIFRGFSELNIENLLYLQSEISHLLEDYQDIARDNYESEDPQRAKFSKEWIKLARSSGSAGKQWRQWLKIRSKLAQYMALDHALIQTSQLLQLPKPPKQQVEILRSWLEHPNEGKSFLRRVDNDIWKEPNEGDLIALATDACQEDAFTRWVANRPLTVFHRYVQYIGERVYPKSQSGDEEAGFTRYSDIKLARLSGGLGTGLGSALTMTSVIVLNYISSKLARLLVIAVFLFLFSLFLSVFTRSRKIEIFAATCAFASVQVVFVGTN
ncbi:hypothetical protein G7Y79_00007g022840 [Physcia stellaris]|nr:hypothetical protein G7Y79_00007g022840 [Physcia stellaris]